MFNFDIMGFLAGVPALILAIAGHEYAHARMATWLGDPTPRLAGRLTLNPMAHIDAVGALAMFLIGFGWARPVPINIAAFKDRRTDELLVALSGPTSNVIMAFIAYCLMIGLDAANLLTSDALYTVLRLIVLYNINFAIFNMLPIPPLDGSSIIMTFMPWQMRVQIYQFGWVSMLVFLLLLNSPIMSAIMYPLQRTILSAFQAIVQLII